MKHTQTIVLADDDAAAGAASRQQKETLRRDPAKVMASIIKQQRSLYSKDVNDYMAAIAEAENIYYPTRTRLYEIYQDMLTDDAFIYGLVHNHRLLAVKNKAFKVYNADKTPSDTKTRLLQKGWFYDTLRWFMESKFWGYSLPYMEDVVFDGTTTWIKKLSLIPRKHVHPEQHVVTPLQYDFEGMDYTRAPINKYVWPMGDVHDLGLLSKAVILWIIKKHGWQNWDEFSEVYGMPIRTVKTASQDPRVITEIEGWLKDMGTAPYGIFPQDTEIDVKPSTQPDAYQVFYQMINAAQDELAILLVGQTMTSKSGASRSQGEVHERVKDEISRDDEVSFQTWVNEFLIPHLRDVHRWPFAPGDEFRFDRQQDLQELLVIYNGINAMGFQLCPQQVSETFGVKIIGVKGDAVLDEGAKSKEQGQGDEPEGGLDEGVKSKEQGVGGEPATGNPKPATDKEPETYDSITHGSEDIDTEA